MKNESDQGIRRVYCEAGMEVYSMWQNFLISLEIMGKGMLGIFVVIGILTLAVSAMGKLSHREEKGQENKD